MKLKFQLLRNNSQMVSTGNFQSENFRTRVLIMSSSVDHSVFIKQIFDFHGKSVDWSGAGSHSAKSDFTVLQTSDVTEAVHFKPTIVLISSEIADTDSAPVFSHITPGGVLVYPQSLEAVVEQANVYFRKLPYSPTDLNEKGGTQYLNTDMGDLPVSGIEARVLADLDGIKLFCAQFGIMEEQFYEALAELV